MANSQIEISAPLPLLDASGKLTQAGWARRPHWQFRAKAVKTAPANLRQWDFFTVMDQRAALSLTLANLRFGGFASAELLDLESRRHSLNIRPFRKLQALQLSAAAGESAVWRGRDGEHVLYERDESGMTLDFCLRAKAILPDMHGKLRLHWPRQQESLSCVFPFTEQPGGFFYECKAPAIAAEGTVVIDHKRYDFIAGEAFAVMDWGRGVWPNKVFWRWGAVTFKCDGRVLGLNLGDGFGDTSAAGENIVIVDGRAHKLGPIDWRLDRKNYLAPWRLDSPDGRALLQFTPVYDQHSNLNLLVKSIRAHRVWGRFAGRVRLDDGSDVQLPPSMGFAEEVWIKW